MVISYGNRTECILATHYTDDDMYTLMYSHIINKSMIQVNIIRDVFRYASIKNLFDRSLYTVIQVHYLK